jgi:hypothetical protein
MQGGKIADSEAMIQRISDKLASTKDIGQKAYIARIAGLSGPEYDLMKRGYKEYRRITSATSEGSPYTFGGEANALKLAQNIGIVSAEFDKLGKSLIHNLCPAVGTFASWLTKINKDRELERAISLASKEVGYGLLSKPGISGDIGQRYRFFSALDKLGVADKALDYFRYSDAERTYEKNYNEWKKWVNSFKDIKDSTGGHLPNYINPSLIPSTPTFHTPGSENVNGNIVLKLDFSNLDESKLSGDTIKLFNEAGSMLLRDISPQLFMGEH